MRKALPSQHAMERVVPIVDAAGWGGYNHEEEMKVAAAIVWEETHEALYEWSDHYTMFDDPLASLGDAINAGADYVVKMFCDERFVSDVDFFVNDCEHACLDLADLEEEDKDLPIYGLSWIREYFVPAWDRVWLRCLQLGLPWEGLGFDEHQPGQVDLVRF